MTEINLLPWRELKREHEKKQFTIYLFAGFAGAAIIVFLINFYGQQLVSNQTYRNNQLQNEIAEMQKKIKEINNIKLLKQALIARMTIVQNLLITRVLTVRLFDELIKVMPKGVFLSKVERSGDKITVLGYAESNSDISALMRNIEKNALIQAPALTEIKKSKDTSSAVEHEFKLSFTLSPTINGQYHE